MSDILDIEHAATRAPQVAGSRYAKQASHRPRGHQLRAADMSDKLDIEHAATRAIQAAGSRSSVIFDIEHAASRAPQAAGSRYVKEA